MIMQHTMGKAFKYASSVSMWLAVAAIWAHMIIPHDHHLSDSFSGQEQNCPASHHQAGDKSEIPLHCHAFNDIASEEARSYHISQIITDGFVALAILPDDLVPESQVPCVRINDFRTPVLNTLLYKTSLLRAPPSLA
jgi:hypothetical protein